MANSTKQLEDRWLEYISKLNDREINRRRSSGFTLWAVSGFIAILIYRILDNLLGINFLKDILLLELTFATVANISFTIVIFVTVLLFHGINFPDIRLSSKIDKAAMPIVYVPLFLFIFLIAVINIHVGYSVRILGISYWTYYIFGIFLLLQIVTPIVQKVHQYIKFKNVYKDMPLLEAPPVFFSPKGKIVAQVVLATLIILFFALSGVQVNQIILNTNILVNISIIKISLEFTALLFMIIFLFFRMSRLVRHEFLTTLERRIVIENLEARDIVKLFAVEYLGETTKEWICKTDENINNLYNNFKKGTETALNQISNIKNIDIKYSYEIKGRRDNICIEYKKIRDEYIQYLKKTLTHITYLGTQKALSSDIGLVKEVVKSWEVQIDEVQKEFTAVCNKCKEIRDDKECKNDDPAS